MSDELLREMGGARMLLPAAVGGVLLTRHSLRQEAANEMPGFDIPLTPAGVRLAEQWGEQIGPIIRGVFSSPSPRCLDTGSAMLRGAQLSGSVEPVDLLREPGCYVQEIALAGPHFRRLGPRHFMNGVLAGQVPGAAVARDASMKLLAWMRGVLPSSGEIAVCVTHDTILGGLVHDLLGRQMEKEEDWPRMLEGAFLWLVHDQWHWTWRGQHYYITSRALAAGMPSSTADD